MLKLCHGDHEEFVFVARGRKPLKRMSGEAWYQALDKAGIPYGTRKGFTFHHCRHTWASFHTMNGTPKEALLALGGVEDIQHGRTLRPPRTRLCGTVCQQHPPDALKHTVSHKKLRPLQSQVCTVMGVV